MTNACLFAPLEDALKAIAGAGFRYVEIMCDRPHMYPDDFSNNQRQELKTTCTSLGLTITGLDAIHINPDSIGLTYWHDTPKRPHFFPDPNGGQPMFTSADPALRRARIEYVKKVIDMAVDLGVEKVETFPGEVTRNPKEAHKDAFDGITECVAYAEQKGVRLVLELSGQLMFGTPDEMMDLIETIGSKHLSACIDVGHLNSEYLPIEDTIWKMRRVIGNIHVDDMLEHKHFHLIPGHGTINWDRCFTMLEKIGYSGSVLLEIYPYALDPIDPLKKSFTYLSKYC
jgi:sugar phosphate isomerase/epimerase